MSTGKGSTGSPPSEGAFDPLEVRLSRRTIPPLNMHQTRPRKAPQSCSSETQNLSTTVVNGVCPRTDSTEDIFTLDEELSEIAFDGCFQDQPGRRRQDSEENEHDSERSLERLSTQIEIEEQSPRSPPPALYGASVPICIPQRRRRPRSDLEEIGKEVDRDEPFVEPHKYVAKTFENKGDLELWNSLVGTRPVPRRPSVRL